MALAINSIYKYFQQTRDMLPDATYQDLFEKNNRVTTENEFKDRLISDIVAYAKVQTQFHQLEIARFKSVINPFKQSDK